MHLVKKQKHLHASKPCYLFIYIRVSKVCGKTEFIMQKLLIT